MIELTPKASFQKSTAAKFHTEIVMRPEFHAAAEAALASYALTHSVTQERLTGARDFLLILLNLAEPPEKADTAVLTHNLWPPQTPPPLTREQLLAKSKEARRPPQP
jgi:hypothetical protein